MRPAPGRRAFTLLELLVVIGIAGILFTICAVALAKARQGRSQAVCATNLHNIGIAFASYCADYQDFFPAPTPTLQWEDLLREYIHRSTFRCPADQELFDSLGSSYDWRDTGNPATTLAGVPRMRVLRGELSLAYDVLPGWHDRDQIQVLHVNSSVDLISQDEFFADLQRAVQLP
jgi:prepilin-type N-terminal cleavage/methylation domain-containing protein